MIIAFIVLGLMAFGVFGFYLLFSTSSKQKKAEANAEQILDDAFDGRDDVVFTVNMTTIKYETAVLGAKARGYKLTHTESNQYGPHTLIFERA